MLICLALYSHTAMPTVTPIPLPLMTSTAAAWRLPKRAATGSIETHHAVGLSRLAATHGDPLEPSTS